MKTVKTRHGTYTICGYPGDNNPASLPCEGERNALLEADDWDGITDFSRRFPPVKDLTPAELELNR